MSSAQVSTYVVCTATTSVSTYQNYQFNSYAVHAGKFLAAGPDGIFQLDTEQTVDVDGVDSLPVVIAIKTGHHDFKTPYIKRLRDVCASAQVISDSTLSVNDGVNTFDYKFKDYSEEYVRPCRVLVGRGIRSRFFQISIEAEAPFVLHDLNIEFEQTTRRA